MGIALLFLIAVSALVGYQAQVGKGRTGAAWGLVTFVLLFVLFFALWPNQRTLVSADQQSREDLSTVIGTFGQAGFAAILAILIGWPIMAIIVATLPKRKAES